MMEMEAPIVRMGWHPDGLSVCVCAFVIFPCTIKSKRWRAVVEEVDKGCSEFCITVGTVTRTAGILIHSRLKALAVNLADFGCMLMPVSYTHLTLPTILRV